ncbi:MAG TPA: carbohydrate-binding family 9-like protein, partial [Ignavibacteriaceae bacterium]
HIKVLENISKMKFKCDDAIGNFYKCGDETEFKHYGMWSLIENSTPDFHLPEYFGKIIFGKNQNLEDLL